MSDGTELQEIQKTPDWSDVTVEMITNPDQEKKNQKSLDKDQ